jgi:uridine kinase
LAFVDYNPGVDTQRLTQPSDNSDFVTSLARQILARRSQDGARGFVVGIDGKGCSGKSHLSRDVVDALRCHGIRSVAASIDDFCNPQAVRYAPDIPEPLQVYHRNFDEQTWIEEVIHPFCTTGRLRFDKLMLDPRSDSYTNRVQIQLDADDVLIAEGLHLRKKTHAGLFSYSVLLHISDEAQISRALVRDARERGKTEDEVRYMYSHRYVPSFRHYRSEDHPYRTADIVIDFENPNHPAVLDERRVADLLSAP